MKKYLGWLIPLLILVFAVSFYLTKGNLLNYLLRPYLETIASEYLDLKVSIEKINLSLWKASLTIENIKMEGASKTFIHIPRLRASVQVLRLFAGHLALNKALIEKPTLRIDMASSQKQKRRIPWIPILSFEFNEIQVQEAALSLFHHDYEIQNPTVSLKIIPHKLKKYWIEVQSRGGTFHTKASSFSLPAVSTTFSFGHNELYFSNLILTLPKLRDFLEFRAEGTLFFTKDKKLISAKILINQVPFLLTTTPSSILLSSEQVDLSKFFTQNYKFQGQGSVQAECSFMNKGAHMKTSLLLKNVFFETLYLGDLQGHFALNSSTLSTQISFKHPHRPSQGKLAALFQNQKGSGSLEIKQFVIGGEGFQLLSLPFTLSEDGSVHFPKILFQKKNGFLEGKGFSDKDKHVHFSFLSQGLNFSEFDTFPFLLEGPLQLNGQLEGALSNPSGQFSIKMERASWIHGTFKNHLIEVRSSFLDNQIIQKGSLKLEAPYAYTIHAQFLQADIAPSLSFLQKKFLDLKTSVVGFFEMQGQLSPSKISSASLKLDRLEFQGHDFHYFNSQPLWLESQGDALRLHPFILSGTNTNLALQGQKNQQGTLSFFLEGPFNFQIFQLFVPFVEKSRGRSKISAKLEGTVSNPKIFGNFLLEEALLKTKGLPFPIEDLSSNIGFSQNKISIDKISGHIGDGTLGVRGEVFLGEKLAPQFNLHAELSQTHFPYPPELKNLISGELTLKGNARPYLLSGRIFIHELLYKENTFLFSSKKEVYLPKTAYLETPLLRFDIDISAPKNVLVKNNLAQLEARGQVRLIGTDMAPNLTGSIAVASGHIFFKGNELELTMGNVKFDHPSSIDPRFLVKAETTIKEYRVFLALEGSGSKYKVLLSSAPALPEADVISLLTVGSTRTEIEKEGGQALSSAELGSLLLGGVEEQVQSAAKKSLGVRVSLSPSYSDTKHATVPRLFLGKNIGKRADTTFTSTLDRTSIFTDKEFNLKLNLNRHLSILGFWEDVSEEKLQNNSSLGLDVKAQFEFR
ncbi:MAG: translocation/assembly module TamB domain-containing protein [Deltaproteobacteria bacterium]|nr:translocation/assembly module TamB domain-containing protein [Deltaproteobacteria bacterium]